MHGATLKIIFMKFYTLVFYRRTVRRFRFSFEWGSFDG